MQRQYPAAPLVSVGVVVKDERRVLLVKRGQEPGKGRWSLPGGVVELGETLRQAARREVREECGLEVEPGPVVDIFEPILSDEEGKIRYHYVVIDLLARYQGGRLTIGSDILDARWVTLDELADFDVTEKAAQLIRRVLTQTS